MIGHAYTLYTRFHTIHVISCLPVCRPIPDREFVETYVKAFYLTENEMERWIREHKVIFFYLSLIISLRCMHGVYFHFEFIYKSRKTNVCCHY